MDELLITILKVAGIIAAIAIPIGGFIKWHYGEIRRVEFKNHELEKQVVGLKEKILPIQQSLDSLENKTTQLNNNLIKLLPGIDSIINKEDGQ